MLDTGGPKRSGSTNGLVDLRSCRRKEPWALSANDLDRYAHLGLPPTPDPRSEPWRRVRPPAPNSRDPKREAQGSRGVTRINRLARSLKDLQDLVHELRAKGVTLKATEQPVDTSTAAGKAFFDMPGVFAEFETNLRRERQREGIAAGKARGVYKGRKPKIHPAEVRRLHAGERLSPTAIARRLGIARSSVYRFLTSTG